MIHSTLISSFLQIQPGWVLDFQHKNFGETQIFKPRHHIKKQRHYFAYKGPYSQSYGFPAVMYGCESWTIKKAEGRRTDAFELWCWRRLLRVPWTARLSNKSIPKEISPAYSLERPAEAPTLWSPDAKSWLIGKDPDTGKDWGQEEKGMTGWHGWMASLIQWTWVWAGFRRWWRTGRPGVLQSMGTQRVRHNWVSEQQQQQLRHLLSQIVCCFKYAHYGKLVSRESGRTRSRSPDIY